MKEEILRLRAEGKTYNQIVSILGCAKSTVSYHCGDGQKEKTRNRTKKSRNEDPMMHKCYAFRSRKLDTVTRDFQRRDGSKLSSANYSFNSGDVIDKFGTITTCYLTGDIIDLSRDEYQFDHIIPCTRGGDNSLDNLGITTKQVNMAKNCLLNEEFFELCKKVLLHNGYQVTKLEEESTRVGTVC